MSALSLNTCLYKSQLSVTDSHGLCKQLKESGERSVLVLANKKRASSVNHFVLILVSCMWRAGSIYGIDVMGGLC